eukprot:3469675-Pyramimonas_sp.AAC.1
MLNRATALPAASFRADNSAGVNFPAAQNQCMFSVASLLHVFTPCASKSTGVVSVGALNSGLM